MWESAVIDWFRANQRPLPWRTHPSAYATLVSEFMAQQTQLTTVIPYFERWMHRFPSLADVANAHEDAIFKQWEGLGYYSRAKNLQRAATIIVRDFNGVIPQSAQQLQTLPGIGPYIAAAIASIAFGEAVAVVDGNVLRVIARFFGLYDDIADQKTKQSIQIRLNRHIAHVHPGDFNQGLMELGALVCTKNPVCDTCCLRPQCYAANMDQIQSLPVKKKAPPVPRHTVVVGLIRRSSDQKILITKRKKDQLLGGLWEFPGGKVRDNESHHDALIRELYEELNMTVCVDDFICTAKHAYSHFKITLHAYYCSVSNTDSFLLKSADDYRWIAPEDVAQFAFPKANRLIFSHIT
jgi:A/G-specific adenine glycosylase